MRRSPLRSTLLLVTGLLVGSALMTGCGEYRVRNLAKSDVNLVADVFIDMSRELVRELTVKLYHRNPRELARNPGMTIERRLVQLSSRPDTLDFNELDDVQEVAAMELAFDPEFSGDRVFALVVGLGGMLRRSYGYNQQMFMLDQLDPELLDTSARNVEILVWRLKNSRREDGSPFLITSEYQGVTDNLSFERLFGKLIAMQDVMSRIAGDADDRRINRAVLTASTMFIPL